MCCEKLPMMLMMMNLFPSPRRSLFAHILRSPLHFLSNRTHVFGRRFGVGNGFKNGVGDILNFKMEVRGLYNKKGIIIKFRILR